MVVIGKVTNNKGYSHLYVSDDFPEWIKRKSNAVGQRTIDKDVGRFDVSNIPVGASIRILYDEVVNYTDDNGNRKTFQPILDIEVLESESEGY